MKQHSLPWQTVKRGWKSTTRPWNELGLSLADEARQRKLADERAEEGPFRVSVQDIREMERMGLLSKSQAEKRDWHAITEVVSDSLKKRLYGRVTARRYA